MKTIDYILASIVVIAGSIGIVYAQLEPVVEPTVEQVKTLEDISDEKIKLKTIEIMASTTLEMNEAIKQTYANNNTDRILEKLDVIISQLSIIHIDLQK